MSIRDRWRGLFGGSKPPAAAPDVPEEHAALAATAAARDRYWTSVGASEPDVIGHLISPSLIGGPAWPNLRPAYRVVRRSGSLILATEGLSDPFYGTDGFGNGFEMELMLETSSVAPELAGAPGDISRLKESWAFDVLSTIADTVAEAGGIMDRLDEFGGVLSAELPGASQARAIASQLPQRFVLDDVVGLLLGAPKPDFPDLIADTPLSPVRVVPVVLLTADELAHIRSGGSAARREVAQGLANGGSSHRCDFDRASII